MSRLPTILLGSLLIVGIAWLAVSVTKVPLELVINGAIAEALGHRVAPSNYADAIFTVLCLLAAAGVGIAAGWQLRGATAQHREADLQRRLNDTKSRLPRLESGMRNKEMQAARAEQQVKNIEGLLPPLHKQIEDRDIALRDRDRTIATLKGELSLLKGTPLAADAPAVALATIELDDDPLDAAGPTADRAIETNRALEARIAELQDTIRQREMRIAELSSAHGAPADQRVQELDAALYGQRKRSEDLDRERQRQDKWLDVLNDQLARAREVNDKLTDELKAQAALQARVIELEAEVKRLNDEIADRERRLTTSRFECATARTTIAHLQAQLAGKNSTTITH